MTTTLTRAEGETFDKKEAGRLMFAEGKKVRRTNWDSFEYFMLSPTGNIVNQHRVYESLNGYSFDGWELYEEPAKPHQNPTLETCLKARKVEIEWPEYTGKSRNIWNRATCMVDGVQHRFWPEEYMSIINTALCLPGAKVTILEG